MTISVLLSSVCSDVCMPSIGYAEQHPKEGVLDLRCLRCPQQKNEVSCVDDFVWRGVCSADLWVLFHEMCAE